MHISRFDFMPIAAPAIAKLPSEVKELPNIKMTSASIDLFKRGQLGQGYIYFIDLKTGDTHLLPAVNVEKKEIKQGSFQHKEKQKNEIHKKIAHINIELEKLSEQIEKDPNQQDLQEKYIHYQNELNTLLNQQGGQKNIVAKLKISKQKVVVLDKEGKPLEPCVVTTSPKTAGQGGTGGGDLHKQGAMILHLQKYYLAGGFWIADHGFEEFRTRSSANMFNIQRNPFFKTFLQTSFAKGDEVGHSMVYAREIPYIFFQKIALQFNKQLYNINNTTMHLPDTIQYHFDLEKSWGREYKDFWFNYFLKIFSSEDKKEDVITASMKDLLQSFNDKSFMEENAPIKAMGLIIALANGKMAMAEAILQSADINMIKICLFNAVQHNDMHLFNYLEKYIDINMIDQYGRSLLHYAVTTSNIPMVNKLLELRAAIFAKDHNELTPVELLMNKMDTSDEISLEDEKILNILYRTLSAETIAELVTAQKNTNEEENEEESVDELNKNILQAAFIGNFERIISLIENNANINTKDEEGYTPLLIAAQQGNVELVKNLLDRKAQLSSNLIGATPLHLAAQNGNIKLMQFLLDTKLSFSPFISTNYFIPGENIMIVDKNLNTPLHYFVSGSENKEADAVINLLQNDINSKNKDGVTPLGLAIQLDNINLAKILLEKGAILGEEKPNSRKMEDLLEQHKKRYSPQ